MKEFFIHTKNLPEAYHQALVLLNDEGELTDCADWNTSQKEVSMTMVVDEPFSEPMISKFFIGGPSDLEQYKEETIDGILDFKAYDGTEEHTYHQLMVDYQGVDINNNIVSINQIQFVIDELKRNPSSRRAIIDIRNNIRDINSSNPTCLIFIQYFIRNNKLESKVVFRSNDACKAAFMDMFAFISLQKYIADKLGIDIGSYYHRANSFHCYARDWDMLKGYVNRIKGATNLSEICYNYKDNWDELMLDSQQDIADKLNLLKNR